jgi:hypothetical protein
MLNSGSYPTYSDYFNHFFLYLNLNAKHIYHFENNSLMKVPPLNKGGNDECLQSGYHGDAIITGLQPTIEIRYPKNSL